MIKAALSFTKATAAQSGLSVKVHKVVSLITISVRYELDAISCIVNIPIYMLETKDVCTSYVVFTVYSVFFYTLETRIAILKLCLESTAFLRGKKEHMQEMFRTFVDVIPISN